MTITQERPTAYVTPSADNGGVPARRAVIRWAWRMVRREWRAQILVLTLLTLSVAAAIGGAAAAYNLTPAGGDAVFGTARYQIEFSKLDAAQLQADTAAAEDYFGAVDVIARRSVPVPGGFDPVELRAQDPDGPYGGPMLALDKGRYPTAAGEVALTDKTASLLAVAIGDTVVLGDETWTVVGVVENPSNLDDEFALVAPSQLAEPDSVTMLVDGSESHFNDFRPPGGSDTSRSVRGVNEGVVAATGVLVASTIVLILVALIAAAGFVVVARRRLRQLGMLAAIGATERHLRLVMVANGAVIGAIAAVVGALLALLAWLALVPLLEGAVRHRIATFDVPWWLIGSGMVLAVLCSTGAAWWPARAIARTSIVSALSGRPDKPRSATRSATLAAVMTAAGTACLAIGSKPTTNWINATLIVAGTAALIVGVLLFSPLAIRTLASQRARAPIAYRLALGDLARYQARSGTALAAISLALGIAVVIVATASGAMYSAASDGNLSDRQLMIRLGAIPNDGDVAVPAGDQTPPDLDAIGAAVDGIAASLGTTAVPIDSAVSPALEGFDGSPAIVLGVEEETTDRGTSYHVVSNLYVASPALLALYGLDQSDIDPDADVITSQTGELWFLPVRDAPVNSAQHLTAGYTSLPGSFITADALARRGWEEAPNSWLIQTEDPITDDQLADVRHQAGAAGVTVESRNTQNGLTTLRNAATGGGAVMALAIMAMTVGLIRSDATSDLRILTASGATSSNRRTLTAVTAGGLAFLGAVLGLAGAYLGLGAAHIHDLQALTPIPYLHLLLIAAGLPLVAGGAGWLLAGREPRWLSRGPAE